MIPRTELMKVSETKSLSLKACEKDYLLELILLNLSDMKRDMIFKGGTALFKFYNLNRFSEDLDFDLIGRRKDPEKLTESLKRRIETRGINGTISEIDDYRNGANIRFLIRGPLYDGNKMSLVRVKINLSKREIPESYEFKTYIPLYSDIPSFQTNVLSAIEIAAEKFRCILTRDKPRDIYDLWFLSKRGIGPDIDLIDRKLEIYDMEYDKSSMISRIGSMEGVWVKDLKGMVIGSLPAFSIVETDLAAWIP
jgi:predicted nucleotidyltransferase component of viral defense system